MEAVSGQKQPSEGKNGMKESIYWKKLLMKVAQQPQKPPDGSNQIWATTSEVAVSFLPEVVAQVWLDPLRGFWGFSATFIKNFFQ